MSVFWFFFFSNRIFSSMTSSLSSMNGSCLQQRDAASSYPYMFHDPLHSLSSTYNHSRAAAVSAACNSAVAHQNSVNTHSSYGSVGSSSSGPSGTGTNNFPQEKIGNSEILLTPNQIFLFPCYYRRDIRGRQRTCTNTESNP